MTDIHDILSLIDRMDPKKTKNAILSFLKIHSIDSWSNLDKANIFTKLAEYSMFTNEYSDASYYFNLATQFFNLPYDDSVVNFLGDYYYHYSSLEIELGNFFNAKNLAERCFEYYSHKNDKGGIAKGYDMLSQVELNLLNFDEAITYAKKSLESHKEIKRRIEISYTNLGEIYRIKGNLDISIEYFDKAIEIGAKNNDYYVLAFNFNNLGLVYSELGAYKPALKYFQKSLENFEHLEIFDAECMIDYTECLISAYSISDPNKDEYLLQIEDNFSNLRKNIFKTRSNTVLVYYFNAIGHYEMKLNNFYRAEEYFLMSMKIAEHHGNHALILAVQTNLINWALKQYNIDKNNYFLEKAKSLLQFAKSIASETMKPSLLAELMVLETIICSYAKLPKYEKILSEVLLYAQKTNDTRLLNKINEECAKILNEIALGKTDIDLWNFQQYFNLIAKLTATHQEN